MDGPDGFAEVRASQRAGFSPALIYVDTRPCQPCDQFRMDVLLAEELEPWLGRFLKVRLDPQAGPEEDQLVADLSLSSLPALHVLAGEQIPTLAVPLAPIVTNRSPKAAAAAFKTAVEATLQRAAAIWLRTEAPLEARISWALALNPDGIDARLLRAREARLRGEQVRAVSDLLHIIAKRPAHAAALAELAAVAVGARCFPRANEFATALLEIARTPTARQRADALAVRALARWRLGELAKARRDAAEGCDGFQHPWACRLVAEMADVQR